MQQFFSDVPLKIGDTYQLNAEQARHAKVLHIKEEKVRLVYEGQGYYATCRRTNDGYECLIEEKDSLSRELPFSITLAIAFIHRDHFEWILQKSCELGVDRIIPLRTQYSDESYFKKDYERKVERWKTILLSSSEQCKRDKIPLLMDPIYLKDLDQVKSHYNLAAYENEWAQGKTLKQSIDQMNSVTIVIGPEGGFSLDEMNQLQSLGYSAYSLGKRILRAETAAIASVSILDGLWEARL